MSAVPNQRREVYRLEGLEHRTLAGAADGLSGVELWRQTLEPGATTPIHYHDCDEAIVVLEGSGRATIGNAVVDFEADTTLTIPAEVVHQLVNTGGRPLRLLAALGASPPNTYAADGAAIPLPWDLV
jgi:mannose-6-phosphate isomerase-like protein (cupin superfamily)